MDILVKKRLRLMVMLEASLLHPELRCVSDPAAVYDFHPQLSVKKFMVHDMIDNIRWYISRNAYANPEAPDPPHRRCLEHSPWPAQQTPSGSTCRLKQY